MSGEDKKPDQRSGADKARDLASYKSERSPSEKTVTRPPNKMVEGGYVKK